MWNMSGIIHRSLLSCGEWGHWSSSSKQENKHGQCLLLDRVMESLEVSADHHLPTSNQRDHPRHQGGGPSFCRHLAPLISCIHFLLVAYFSLKVFGLIVEQVKTTKINDKCQRFFFPVCMIRGMRTTSFSEYIYLGTLFGFNFCILTTCAHLHNWMAWCKTDLSDIFGQIFFPSKVLCFSI